MSELNYLEKLLDGTEVEWKALGDVTSVLRGKRLTKNLLSAEEKFPVFHGGLEPLGYYNKSNRPANTVMIINVGASAGTVGYSTVDFWSSDGCFCLEHNELLNNRFLYFALIGYQSLLKSKVRVAGIPTLDAIVVNKLLIPIPCPENPEKSLAIQSEIVRILDKFTALTAELTAELNMRKKQYNYYRDQLFSFGAHDVKRLKLGELCVIGDGLHGTPEYDANGDYFFINGNNLGYQKISFNDNTKKVNDSMFKKHGIHFDPINTVFLSINGTIGNVSFYNNEKIVLGKSVAYFKIKSPELHTRYLFYFLQTNYAKQYFENQKTGSTIKNLGLKSLRAFEIPIPSYDEQLYIVATMDKFYNLTNSITEGLPREIELRQKQYEYYRDLLFSFPKPETVSN
ncbi:restriction endonuclease subunit S [Escherichia coli]|jgi:type I restriction enzyme S subunit|uniref:restriction endonuclease subunit S n=1 Tax=Escherichia coli TaxID=562 RepID=UPI000BE7CBEA|nr:restriction endonuclease subunit S [Escherichia coli]EEV7151772.1 restriction endonuclease subunit S [Escherichia coli]EEW2730409.1 restriction endonuclease subunit S [Escherichia coli]EEW7484403.1 restriction endonuclease subunit S [Escherichia coli]EEY8044453.1 restriction endonuclease subunit S [Escherichia coli]EFA8005300.1 restriction endonuclease subunit S [Escherichia coli]